MARKKRRADGDRPQPRRRRKSPPGTLPDLPDRRAIEGKTWPLVGGPWQEGYADTPLGKAQQIVYRAFEEKSPHRRVELARQALELSPDCADAYVLLAEHSRSRKEALDLYGKGVAAGERALGPQLFEDQVGHFWGILETRPYMRARLGLADALWMAGRREEAAQHLQDMLRLNPNDNQGLRYTLAGYLLFLDRDDDVERLLQQFPEEGSATWAYTKALLAYRRQGDTPEARAFLKVAQKNNKHIPAYLLGHKYPPLEQPPYYSHGDENEALIYIGSFLSAWKNTAGAIAWLRANNARAKKRTPRGPQPKGPLAMVKRWLKDRLPQEPDVWQADGRPLPNLVRDGGQKVRPWVTLVTSRSHDLVLAHDLQVEEPSAALLWDKLVQAMQNPLAGEPHRPTVVQVRPGERWESLRPHLGEIGVELVVTDELDLTDEVFTDLCERIGEPPGPSLLDMPGISPEQVGSFYEAAAHFYQQAPWKKVGYEAAIQVACDKYQSGPWYAVLMGQSGLAIGLALYEDLGILQRMWTGEAADEENARQTVGTSVTFGEETDLPLAELEAAKRYGWKVARPDAYPSVFHKERGLSMRPPLAWELELLEGCLRALPDFVNRHAQEDPAREEMTVPVAAGSLTLALSWVVDGGA